MKCSFLLLFVCFLTVFVDAQQSKKTIHQTVACNGWTVPPFNSLVSQTINDDPIQIEEIKVERKIHKLSTEQLVYLGACDAERDKSKNKQKTFAVNNFVSYEVNGRIFAYEIFYHYVDVKKGAVANRYFATTGPRYVDMDGNGTFEMQTSENFDFKKLPDWLKK